MTEAIPATFSNTNLMPAIANQIKKQFILSNQHIHAVMIMQDFLSQKFKL
jgi:hypothetical protein